MFGFFRHPKQTVKQIVIAKAATKVLAPLKENSTVKNWKTTAAGVATILSVLAKVAAHDWQVSGEDVALVTGAIGLLTAADHDVAAGGTK